jgi:hypothetical protein
LESGWRKGISNYYLRIGDITKDRLREESHIGHFFI